MMHDGMALIARSHDPNICQKRTEKSRKLQFRRIYKLPLLSLLFSESHLSARGNNHPTTVARQHGERELKRKGGAAFLYKSQISNLVWKIRLKMPGPSSKCVKFSSALNGIKINLILCLLRELEPFEIFKVDKSEKVPYTQ